MNTTHPTEPRRQGGRFLATPSLLWLAAFLVSTSAPVQAAQCDVDLQEVDAALESGPQFSEEARNWATQAGVDLRFPQHLLDAAVSERNKGADRCAAGADGEAVEHLGLAKRILGIDAAQ